MIKKIFYIHIVLILVASCSKDSLVVRSINKNNVLEKIKKDVLNNFRKEPMFPQIIDAPNFILDQYVNREKTTYLKFDVDLLFANVILTNDNRFIVYIELQKNSKNYRECVLSTTTFENYNNEYKCTSEAAKCLLGKNVTDISAYNKCYATEICKKVMPSHLEKIEKIYCEKLYGRSL